MNKHLNDIINKYTELSKNSNKKKNIELEFKITNGNIISNIFIESSKIKLKESKKSKTYETIYDQEHASIRVLDDKSISKKVPILMQSFNEFRLTLNTEEIIGELPKNTSYKIMRYKDRISYISKAYPAWRFDITSTISGINKKEINKRIESKGNDIEVEIEYIGDGKDLESDVKSVIDLIESIHPIAIIRKTLDKHSLLTTSQLGNFPKTLTINNINAIRENHSVAEKTDGERVFLIVLGDKVYMLQKPLLLSELKKVDKKKNTNVSNEIDLFDSEYVSSLDKFFIFDVLISAGKSVVDLPFTERLNIIQNNVILDKNIVPKKQHFNNNSDVSKNNSHGNIYELSNKVYHAKYPYHIDGLIYTNLLGNYYSPIYKWKPTNELTIDFLIRIVNKKDGVITVNLYSTLMKKDMERLGYRFEKDYYDLFPFISKEASSFPYKFIPFQTAEIPIKVDSKNGVNKYGEIPIIDNTIIEFTYDNNEPAKFMKWKPYRLRKDKTLEYLAGISQGKYLGGPNEYKIAKEQLDAILHPIPEDVIFGKEKMDVKYYASHNSGRNNVKLYNFNNYVKSQLFNKYTMKKSNSVGETNVMDLAAGRGGDLCKHIMNHVAYLLHIDIDADALKEAKKRMEEYKSGKMKCISGKIETQVDFVVGDLLDKTTLTKINKTAGDKQFDLISCNFAIHYFLQSKKSFEIIVDIIQKYLKPGGHFFFTGLDGRMIYNELISTNSLVYKKNNDVIYQIDKLYKNKDMKNFGQEIDVFVKKIGIKHKEYLLNFEEIQKILESIGLELVLNETFDKKLDEWHKKVELNEDEVKLIKLERYMVFKRI